jgi:ADP-ribosylglycohydrolase
MPRPIADRARFRGALLGCALGDAIGRPFEMMSTSDARLAPALDRHLAASAPLSVSDDTEMTMAVAASLIRVGGASRDDLLRSLVEHADVARGYGHGTRLALETHARGRGSPAFATWQEGSRGAGGAVRSVGVALMYCQRPELVPAYATRRLARTPRTGPSRSGRAPGAGGRAAGFGSVALVRTSSRGTLAFLHLAWMLVWFT